MIGQRRDYIINVLFHGVGTPRRLLEPGEDRYWVDRQRFLRLLDELVGRPEVRISFDDGNISALDIAMPALVERGLRADFFVVAGRLGEPGSLDADGVRELHRWGMGVGTHGMAHRSWRGMDPPTRTRELVLAREQLSGVVGAAVDVGACPLGRYDRRLLADLRRLGYHRIYTSDRRWSRDGAWLQPRFSVRRHDTPASLRATVLHRSVADRSARRVIGLIKRLR